MANTLNLKQWQTELVDACKYGEEEKARALLTQPGARKARTLLEAMLADPDALVRQAAAFGLGELGGSASARRLEQQLTLEEARGDYDGKSVAEAITEVLGRIKEAGARATLIRRLERLATSEAALSDVNTLARALWHKRHPDMLPAIRKALQQLALSSLNSLHGLLLLLEKSPDELGAWARDPLVPVEHKTEVLTVLEEDLPDTLVITLPSFISIAQSLMEQAAHQQGEASYFCERLFICLLMHEQRVLSVLPQETLSSLRAVARTLVAGRSLGCAIRAASMLEVIGQFEDAALIKAHRPAEPILAKVFDDAARALRQRGK